MANLSEIAVAVEKKGDLKPKLVKMWNEGASAAEMAETLQQAGVDVEVGLVEEGLAKLQKNRAAAIADEGVDDDQLKMVAGGRQWYMQRHGQLRQELQEIPGGSPIKCCSWTDNCDEYYEEVCYMFD